MAQRFIEGLNNHERLSKYSYKKYETRSPIGQLRTMYSIDSARPFISVRLPEKRMTGNGGTQASLQDVTQLLNKSPRMKSAPVWIKVPNHTEMLELCSLGEIPKPRRVVFSRPYTVAVNESNAREPGDRKSTTMSAGRRRSSSQNKPTLYRFKPLRIQESVYSKQNIELCTALIKEQWDSRKRQYIKTGIYARGRPEAKDQELLQWFTFEGDSPGALSAFTRDEERQAETNNKFSIEANVGKDVAAKLVLGGTVRIGSNGKLIQGPATETSGVDEFYNRCEEVLEMTRFAAHKHEPLYPPLCWNDLEKEAKILTSRCKDGVVSSGQVCKTEPVVYNKTPQVKPYVPPNSQMDISRLSTLLSHKVSQKAPEPQPTMTYDEILESCAPESSRNEKTISEFPSRPPMPTRENTETGRPNSVMLSRLNKSAHPHLSNKLVNKSLSARVRTPTIPDEVKSGIQRQVTMPAYKIVPGSIDKVAGRPNTSQDIFHERVPTPSRPPKYIPVYNAGGGTNPSISQNGVEGDKSYVQITRPFSHLIAQESYAQFPAHTKMDVERRPRVPHFSSEHIKRPHNTPANLSSVALIGKAPPFEDVFKFQQESKSQTMDSDGSSLTEATKLDNLERSGAEEDHHANRLAINIPAVDMISASSAAVNSIADFQEFDNSIVKTHEELKDRNNNTISDGESIVVDSDHDDDNLERSRSLNRASNANRPPSVDSFNDIDSVDFSISVDIGIRPGTAVQSS